MLGKLIKYETKATARTFLPLYLALVSLILLLKLFGYDLDSSFDTTISGVIMTVIFGLFFSIGIGTLVVLINRFRKNLLGDEGYLMFTLPVKSYQLILSKIIVTVIWSIASSIVFGCVSLVMVSMTGEITLGLLIREIVNNLSHMSGKDILELLLVSLVMIGMGIQFTLIIYNALAVAHLPKLSKHRGITSFVAMIILINLVFNVNRVIFDNIEVIDVELMELFCVVVCVYIINAVLFVGVNYILSKHLNLE